MQLLLSPLGDQALVDVMRHRPLLAFDFDGTLAPIVSRPDDARVPEATADTLAQLARLVPVAVITGRAVNDVVARLGFAPTYVIGNHGAEDPTGELVGGTLERMQPMRAQLAARAESLQAAGVTIEDKTYSLALHYRLSSDLPAALALIDILLKEASDGLHVFHGKCVVNLAPGDAPNKGDAVKALLARSGASAAVFLGDDLNDEPVFEQAEPHWVTARIGVNDTPSRAQFFLTDQHEVPVLLQRLLDLLNGSGSAAGQAGAQG